MLLAGPLRWIPRPLARRLRRYVEDGGRLASFGTDSMRRGVHVGPNRLTRPTQPTPTDPFGARLEPVAARAPGRTAGRRCRSPRSPRTRRSGSSPAPTACWTRSAGSRSPRRAPETRRAKVLTALGQDVTDAERAEAEAKGELPRKALPALTATRLGKGIVDPRRADRVGAAGAGTDREVAQITHNIVDILRRVTPRVRSAGR